jgi:hypothetical protein
MLTQGSCVLAAMLVLPPMLHGGTEFDDLESRNKRATSTAEGRDYEQKAVATFWGDAAFMRSCVAADAPIQEPSRSISS